MCEVSSETFPYKRKMREEYYLLQTYEIFLKLIYIKLLQEYLNNEIIGFTDCENNEETAYYTLTDTQHYGSSFISEDPARDDSKTDYENALNFVNKASPKYNLYTNNCVDFAIKVADKANVKLPEFGIGSNPSTLLKIVYFICLPLFFSLWLYNNI